MFKFKKINLEIQSRVKRTYRGFSDLSGVMRLTKRPFLPLINESVIWPIKGLILVSLNTFHFWCFDVITVPS